MRHLLPVSLAALILLSACATVPDDVSVACARGRPGPIAGDWTLDRIDGVPWRLSRATLLAQEQGFGGTLACNGYGTSEPADGGPHYAVARGRLAIEGDLVVSATGCMPPQALLFEAAFLTILDGEPHVAINGERLCLYTDDGASLEFLREGAAS